ncbi:TrbI/VirB10 family protein [Sphingopyxis sp. DBS4]|uniref:TrbI/VirB10 family protein n=1 Tax=Sphingopyxis sp. DBS4 TaxID=2968500 RepID=UPI00214BEB9A|nr:TrbI/VirB10 family protein [Sphingopyxis sp. DBS4]
MTAPDAPPDGPVEPAERGTMPRVARPSSGLSGTAILIGAVLAGILLFSILDARRRALSAPAVRPARADLVAASETPPPLYIPPAQPAAMAIPLTQAPGPVPIQPAPQGRSAVVPPQEPAPMTPPPLSYAPPPPVAPPRSASGAILVVDSSQPQAAASEGASGAGGSPLPSGSADVAGRSRAGAMSDRATTVPQGTLIPAVLETGFNSTGSGFARALVQRDVYGFDGTRVLIPRGSRLIGDYRSETSPGQKRAFVTWTRLIRPDGVTIAIGSPTTDPVGVGGVRAKVDSHFFERFAGSILQTAMLIGGNLAARSAGDSVVVALPGSFPAAGTATPATEIPPTLSVRQGTSISVFVARDLDFTAVEARR